MIGHFRIPVKIATELLQSSLRGYGSCRFGVTAIVASGLRQTSQRGYDKRRNEVTTNIFAEHQ
ncbi:MAG: hypothetical protein HXN55_00150 [Prevotella nigrescens]|uniref:Uncharacterized protein n=1 Tax=Prevotella nigrescens TaxID=28133 RepID=A0A9D6A9W7_9BACT|nr:hypothetical protein [Prevotella nigrescens]MBF1445787.1 hypothetical protein [Prevotella nigrescens]